MLRMDPPDHDRLRSLVSKAFTPRALAAIRPAIQQQLDEENCRNDRRCGRQPRLDPATKISSRPHEPAEQEQRGEEMRGKAEVADISQVSADARIDHIPAERALTANEGEHGKQPRLVSLRDHAPHPEPDHREEEGEPNDAAKNAVKPLPEVDELELVQVHSRWTTLELVLTRLLVELIFSDPGCLG